MAGVDVSDIGTGISFSPATRFPHLSGDAVQALGSAITMDRPLAKGHAYGAAVINPLATTVGYQGTPAPNQWFGATLSTRAGSIALMDASGTVVVDAMVYGSQQGNSSGNGTITSPEIATLEADQGKGGCMAVVPTPPRAIGPAGAPCDTGNRSLGRFPDGTDSDNLCTDFLMQPATTLAAPTSGGAATIKVASVAAFAPRQTIMIDTGANLETAVIATVGTAGTTTASAVTEIGATVIPVAGAIGFTAGQTITIDSGANRGTAVVVSATGGRGGARITVAAPLTVAHAAGAQISGSGITLASALARSHATGRRSPAALPHPEHLIKSIRSRECNPTRRVLAAFAWRATTRGAASSGSFSPRRSRSPVCADLPHSSRQYKFGPLSIPRSAKSTPPCDNSCNAHLHRSSAMEPLYGSSRDGPAMRAGTEPLRFGQRTKSCAARRLRRSEPLRPMPPGNRRDISADGNGAVLLPRDATEHGGGT